MDSQNFTVSCDETLTNAEWTAAADVATLVLFSVFKSTQSPTPELIKSIAKILKNNGIQNVNG
jgi:hypothetical protein